MASERSQRYTRRSEAAVLRLVEAEEFESRHDESYFGGEACYYTGSVDEQNRRHGQGVCCYACGDVYAGEWRNDACDGRGTKKFDNGDLFVGDWKENHPHGFGVFEYSCGPRYEGNFDDGRYAGFGTMRRNGKLVAEGDWSTWTWTQGAWDQPYPREGGRGCQVTARHSTGGKAPRKRLA